VLEGNIGVEDQLLGRVLREKANYWLEYWRRRPTAGWNIGGEDQLLDGILGEKTNCWMEYWGRRPTAGWNIG
jgi:hypothetical protein